MIVLHDALTQSGPDKILLNVSKITMVSWMENGVPDRGIGPCAMITCDSLAVLWMVGREQYEALLDLCNVHVIPGSAPFDPNNN
jgi:hypothetical protein